MSAYAATLQGAPFDVPAFFAASVQSLLALAYMTAAKARRLRRMGCLR